MGEPSYTLSEAESTTFYPEQTIGFAHLHGGYFGAVSCGYLSVSGRGMVAAWHSAQVEVACHRTQEPPSF
jgi:hypothetical protein